MPFTPEEQELAEQFAEQYQLAQTPVMLELERSYCGCDYGGTSWTTRGEAEQVARLLQLGPGTRFLEVGSGSGWPALYLARTTGCDTTLTDVPLEALRIAARRATAERLAGVCWLALADGAALPFVDDWFDAISHSDVLCCLEAKPGVLMACRRVIRTDGKMVFTVISITSDLSTAEHERATESGPPFVEAEADYPSLLRRTGWDIANCVDLTAVYRDSIHRLIGEFEARANGLSEFFGAAEFDEMLAKRRRALRAVDEGLLQRELFVATPDSA